MSFTALILPLRLQQVECDITLYLEGLCSEVYEDNLTFSFQKSSDVHSHWNRIALLCLTQHPYDVMFYHGPHLCVYCPTTD